MAIATCVFKIKRKSIFIAIVSSSWKELQYRGSYADWISYVTTKGGRIKARYAHRVNYGKFHIEIL